jgi:SAM-dependent methyltransferase
VSTAAARWADQLAGWGIPEEILARAPESPWAFSVDLFRRRAEAATTTITPSTRAALDTLPEGGSVLDVGCGAGAASIPLAKRAGLLVGVDSSRDMLDAFQDQAESAGVRAVAVAVEGSWPDVAGQVDPADVVVCHHVFYNAPDLPAFASGLTDHARRRVVVEMTRWHPRKSRNPLWLRFHGLERPEGPTADDAVEVLREMGIEPDREDWENPAGSSFGAREDLVANLRKELCLTPDRDDEISVAIQGWAVERDGAWAFPPAPLVTLSWRGTG